MGWTVATYYASSVHAVLGPVSFQAMMIYPVWHSPRTPIQVFLLLTLCSTPITSKFLQTAIQSRFKEFQILDPNCNVSVRVVIMHALVHGDAGLRSFTVKLLND